MKSLKGIFGQFIAIAILISAAVAQAETHKYPLRIDDLKSKGALRFGVVSSDSSISGPVLKLTIGAEAAGKQTGILSLPRNNAAARLYGLSGLIRYDEVAGPGYLELINHLSTDGFFFSRTLAQMGPMQALQGSSNWRPFFLPADARGVTATVNSVDFNIILPHGGTVLLANLTGLDFDTETDENGFIQDLFSQEQGSGSYPLGRILGGVFGVVGALIGVLTALRKGRQMVSSLLLLCIVAGIGLLAVSAIEVLGGDAVMAHYDKLLCGVLLTAIAGGNYKPFMKRFEDAELRKMQAMDS